MGPRLPAASPEGIAHPLGFLVAAEALLFASYRGHEAGFHWATHFLVGMCAWALVNGLWFGLNGAPAPLQVLTLLGWHLLAMFPDLLFARGHVSHDDRMDVFLGHLSSHEVPGGVKGWLPLALAMSGVYALLLGRWLAARHSEADAGMRPAVGMSGAHLLRPQRPPDTTPSPIGAMDRSGPLGWCSCTDSRRRRPSGGRSPTSSAAVTSRCWFRTCSVSAAPAASEPPSGSTAGCGPGAAHGGDGIP